MEVEKEMMRGTHEDKKRKMKTPLQLETLERVFAEEKYPSEAIRARLSIQLGLSNRQLKMWFCHRRLKERKSKEEDEDPGSSDKSSQQLKEAPPHRHSALFPSPPHKADYSFKKEEQLSGGSYHSQDDFAWKFRRRSEGFKEKDIDSPKRKRSRQTISNGADSWRVAELQAIASVEAQLGEPLRWDSPCLGIEFDPLPPGAFASTLVPFPHWKPSPVQDSKSRLERKSNSSKSDFWLQREPALVEKARSRKVVATDDNGQSVNSRAGSRLLQEYQFIPERPTGRDGMSSPYDRSANQKVFLGPENNRQGLMLQSPFIQGSENLTNAFGFEGKQMNAGGSLLLQRDMYNTFVFPQPHLLRQDSFPNFGFDGHFPGYSNLYHILPAGSSLHGLEKLPNYDEQEAMGGNKKRKIEEIKVVKEVEAHVKRAQKEIEREELARRKRDEQMQKEKEKEAERLMREKQREDERLMRDRQREDERLQRERQREDERLQREARRESERQEKFMQKEAQRLEREREKEEARRQKEATRLKAAIERATARRLARECVELIDDERLELLEVAASSQGLPSIYLLDGETLQGLDRYKDFLKKFPPAAVKMKKPLAMSPWIESQQNHGNLFMVWRFLIAFADVLGLWPFTLDEFVQAFHDYESWLLSEIHVALFKTIVKDIEDMAKASASAGAVNQYTAPSTIGGGHTQLIEAAFAWGFDYRDWSRYLNTSTWPEILRQFSLAAGFGGPKWKQQHIGQNVDEDHQIHQKGNAAVSSLRSGTAVTNAATLLKVKGGSQARGARLTPGTVKFAAFHVLSVEGPSGLPIVEIVARIEKYGLRDLSTSKTPESSVAAALSRDTTFFERVAPSTYCVKPAYRKKPEDAERLLQAALERIRLFQSGILDANDEENTEASDEVEKEQPSGEESDNMAVDDMHGVLGKGKVTFSLKERKGFVTGEQNSGDSAGKTKNLGLPGKGVSNSESRGKHALLSSLVASGSVQDEREKREQIDKTLTSAKDNEIDESHGGEPWVQGLSEGEYADLSVEERLNALVALVEAVNEGNTVRVALEERLEGATALKRQMWAEAQLDKRRTKEEQLSKSHSQISGEGITSEGPNMSHGTRDGNSSAPVDDAEMEGKKSPSNDKEPGMQECQNQDTPVMGISSEKSRAQLKVDIDFRADELYVFRSLPLGLDRRHNRYWQFVTSHAAEDPGCGRIYFESSEDGHWEVIDTEEAFSALLTNLDTRGVREAHLHGVLLKLENLIRQGMKRFASNTRPKQRLAANQSAAKAADSFRFESSSNGVFSPSHAVHMEEDGSSGDGTVFSDKESGRHAGAIQIHIGNIQSERQCVLDRYMEFDKWFWSKETPEFSVLVAVKLNKKRCPELLAKCEVCHDLYWQEDNHCSWCHATFEASGKRDVKYMQHVSECELSWSERNAKEKLQYLFRIPPSRVQLLKGQFLCVEAAIPAEALKSSWTETRRKAWAASLKLALSSSTLLQLLYELECAIHRDWLSRRFESAKELSESASINTVASPAVFPRVPRTMAAVAMRLLEFDSALFYSLEQKLGSNRRKKPSSGSGLAVPVKKSQIAVSDGLVSSIGERQKEADNKQPDKKCSTGKSPTRQGATKSDSTTEREAMKFRLHLSRKPSDTVVMKDRQSIDPGDNVCSPDKTESASVDGRHSGCDKHRKVSKTQMVDEKHEFHRNEWASALDANDARSARHNEDDEAYSGTDEEEVIIEDEYEEEDDGPFEGRNQTKEWVAVTEDGETYSTEEESEDRDGDKDDEEGNESEHEPDPGNVIEHDLMSSEEDSEDEHREHGSSDSEEDDENGDGDKGEEEAANEHELYRRNEQEHDLMRSEDSESEHREDGTSDSESFDESE